MSGKSSCSWSQMCVLLWIVTGSMASHAQDEPGNSMKKERVKPDEIASEAGQAIEWQTDLAAAQAKSAESGKPVLWYVPTLNDTFMDRKPVIDQYMLAGPWSWPAIVNLVNERFVPLRATPDDVAAGQYGLQRYEFVEPGFVVLGPEGNLQKKLDRLTTLHPHWLYGQLASAGGDQRTWSEASGEPAAGREPLDAEWERQIAADFLAPEVAIKLAAGLEMEHELLRGMIRFRAGEHDQARAIWGEAGRKYRGHPLAAKAAMEAQGIGPFGRGFEVFGPLSPKAMLAGTESASSAAPDGTYSEAELWGRSVRFLLGMQNANGGFFDSDYDFGGADSLANVHVAVTALAGLALFAAQDRIEDDLLLRRVEEATARAVKFCRDDANINPADKDEILWAEAYRLRLACEASIRDLEGERVGEIDRIAKRLENLQLASGTWFHEYPNSFVTATALMALADAKGAGGTVDQEKVDAGLRRLASQQFANGAWPYSQRREGGENRREEPVPASAGRIPLCQLARFRWGQIEPAELAAAATIGLEHHALLARALKYDNHTDTYAYGGFFFWYDMQSRSETIAAVEDPAVRKELAARQHQLVMTLPELDGCFVDSHELGRCYGTAMALLSLDLLGEAVKKD